MPSHNKEVTLDQLLKRLKLLYTLVNRIHTLLCPKDNEDQTFEYENGEDDPQMAHKNATHTVLKNYETYVNSPRKGSNFESRSIFARNNIRSSTKNFPLAKLTKRFGAQRNAELSFSVQLDRLFDESNENNLVSNGTFCMKPLDRFRDPSLSVLYNFSPIRKRPSLRKAVLNKQYKVPVATASVFDGNTTYDKESVMDVNTSLQITGTYFC